MQLKGEEMARLLECIKELQSWKSFMCLKKQTSTQELWILRRCSMVGVYILVSF